MSVYVVDASVAAKWLFPEPLSDAAARLLSEDNRLLAPDWLVVEVGNVLVKKVRAGSLELADAVARSDWSEFFNDLVASPPLVPRAAELALHHGRSIYDCLYVALALRENCPMVTADERLYNALQSSEIANTILSIRQFGRPIT
ncbi:MAG: type II toxin-antitoxin system VapC family toxin [Dehalococcoidia bacterium]